MSRGTDDDPLAWVGDDDPTLEVGAKPAAREPIAPQDTTEPDTVETTDAEPKALPDGFTAVGKGSDEVGRIRADGSVSDAGGARADGQRDPDHARHPRRLLPRSTRSAGSSAACGCRAAPTYLVTDVMYQGSFWLAVLAPALWFGTVFLLTRHSEPWVRIRVAHRAAWRCCCRGRSS